MFRKNLVWLKESACLYYFSLFIVSIDDMDKFKEKEITKKRTFTKNTWYNWLINYISKHIKKNLG